MTAEEAVWKLGKFQEDYCRVLDMQGATLDDISMRKSTSKGDRERHRSVMVAMLEIAIDNGITAEFAKENKGGRAVDMLELVESGKTIKEAVKTYADKIEAMFK